MSAVAPKAEVRSGSTTARRQMRRLHRGQRAAKRLGAILDSGSIEINVNKPDRYGRPLVWLGVDGENVCRILIRERLAVAYHGRGPRMD
jgi:endonuclease YncB( thermonuclease family)